MAMLQKDHDRHNLGSCAVLSVAQMAEADRLTISAGTPGVLLMQRAGEAVAREIERRFTPRAVSVLCGPGNNGGAGFFVAGPLAASGWAGRPAPLANVESPAGDASLAV